ncbi:MAG: hypothetical protein P8Z30_12475 [Acidobacteriota bacterium]
MVDLNALMSGAWILATARPRVARVPAVRRRKIRGQFTVTVPHREVVPMHKGSGRPCIGPTLPEEKGTSLPVRRAGRVVLKARLFYHGNRQIRLTA